MSNNYLYEELHSFRRTRHAQQALPLVEEEYHYIFKNLNPDKPIRDYQMKCLEDFYLYNWSYLDENKQQWHLFHMATGSGKTYIMASLILHYFKQGYRNFLFFVNQTNIIEKTKENFLNKSHSKYLFNSKITIDGKNVEVRSVNNFQESDKNCINILFTTIQGLHDRLNTILENGISWEDFSDKTVLIADEAHHLNADTRAKKKEREEEAETLMHWETTVNHLFRNNKDNVMLEFTATCDLENREIENKYKGHPADILFSYPLSEFRKSGYTKELSNVRTSLDKIHKILQAMILSQYRLKLFESDKIKKANTKPVILCKESDTITKLDETYEEYLDFMKNKISTRDIDIVRKQASDFVQDAFEYFDKNNISDDDLLNELQISFSEEHSIKVHSKVKDISSLQVRLNDLENPENPYRIVFTVDMLSEGWDVLNLFDIVRLYDERKDADKVSKTTIQEAQLIGRGARYYPYTLKEFDPTNNLDIDKRKFREGDTNPLRICDTLLYHCIDEARYISDLKKALKETGFSESEEEFEFTYSLKEQFRESKDYKRGKLFVNKQEEKGREDINSIPSSFTIHTETHEIRKTRVDALFSDEVVQQERLNEKNNQLKVKDIDKRIVTKALRQYEIFDFNRLQLYFPNLKSHTEFITSDDYAGRYELNIYKEDAINNIDIYNALLILFEKLSSKISAIKQEYYGTFVFEEVPMSKYVVDVTRKKRLSTDEIENNQGEGISQSAPQVDSSFRLDLSDKDWYVFNDNFGTTEEKRFVKFFSQKVDKLKEKYDKVFLIRNEQKLKIYAFDDGKGFEPDYILILEKNGTTKEQQHIFIEPKGEHLEETDKWKEDFLNQLEQIAECKVYHSDDKYRIIGMPFYTHQNEEKFKTKFEQFTINN